MEDAGAEAESLDHCWFCGAKDYKVIDTTHYGGMTQEHRERNKCGTQWSVGISDE